jgi:23S rRNA (uracil1939-C5)-methyltransferase
VNAFRNQAMVQKALDLLEVKSTDSVLDLFCGLGNFTLPLAKKAKWVTGVEGENLMIERAKSNAKLNALSNLSFYVNNLQTTTIDAPWINQSFDKILLDPPRTGALELMHLIPKFMPSRIVYVSCNPATMARDLGILVNEYGFHLKALGIMDMFPQTSHVESIAILMNSKKPKN